jgi:hypothetical protein
MGAIVFERVVRVVDALEGRTGEQRKREREEKGEVSNYG